MDDKTIPLSTAVEDALWAAIGRVEAGQPTHPDLMARARLGKLRLNFQTVALEANCSRTLIGFDNCPYPKVRAYLLESKEEKKSSALAAELVNLKARITELEGELKARDTMHAEILLRSRTVQLGLRPDRLSAGVAGIEERRKAMRVVGGQQVPTDDCLGGSA